MDEIVRILCRQINVCIGSRVRIPHRTAAVLAERLSSRMSLSGTPHAAATFAKRTASGSGKIPSVLRPRPPVKSTFGAQPARYSSAARRAISVLKLPKPTMQSAFTRGWPMRR